MKSLKNSLIIILLFISTVTIYSQPTWVAPYPTASNINAANCDLNVKLTNLTGDVTVYYIVWRFQRVSIKTDVKAWAINPSSCPDYPNTMLGGGYFTYNLGDAGTVKSVFFGNLLPNRPANQANFTVEYGGGSLTTTAATPTFSNPACPTSVMSTMN